jgi:uncharacterized protein
VAGDGRRPGVGGTITKDGVSGDDPGAPTERTRLGRHPERGRHDRATVDAILDEALFCHLGFLDRGQPIVIPTIHARMGDQVYVHGSTGSRAMRAVSPGAPVCLTVTILDGLVLARSAFNHSMNYRSVMVLGTAREVTDPDEKLAAMRAVVEHVARGRWDEVRVPTRKEVAATTIVALGLEEASAKVRTGPPHDDEEDLGLPVWAGELPIALAAGDPTPDPTLGTALPVSASVDTWRRP